MQTSLAENLRNTTLRSLDASSPAYSLRREALEIKSILQEAGGFAAEGGESISTGETITPTGVAISPRMAAMCLDDFARTVVFIRGVHDAIRDLHKQSEGRTLHVLYAGCGPLAPLAIPLMTVISPETARFTLIDIHSESVESVNRIVDAIGLNDNILAVKNINAAEYADAEPDLMIIEMMRAGLEAEPQVEVSRQLVQRFPNALLLPESITVDLVLQGALKENGSDRDRVLVGRIVTVDKNELTRPSQNNAIGSEISIQLPEFDEAHLAPMLYTTVQVSREHVLREFDSGITIPKRLPIKYRVRSGDALSFRYETGESPGLIVNHSSAHRSSMETDRS